MIVSIEKHESLLHDISVLSGRACESCRRGVRASRVLSGVRASRVKGRASRVVGACVQVV